MIVVHEQLRKCIYSEEKIQNGEFETKGNLITYHPKNPKKIILVVIDHMGLLRSAKGRTKKQEIDLACEYLLNLRNTCGISPLPIMQVNRDSSGMDRRNGGFSEPQRSDVKDLNYVEHI